MRALKSDNILLWYAKHIAQMSKIKQCQMQIGLDTLFSVWFVFRLLCSSSIIKEEIRFS